VTVFVLHPVKDDLTPALHFGRLKFLHTGYLFPDQLDNAADASGSPRFFTYAPPADWRAKMEAHAAAFDPRCDYLLMVGDHLQLLAFTALLAVRHPWFTALRYSRESNGYLPVRISAQAG
jgi:hypothetical protein